MLEKRIWLVTLFLSLMCLALWQMKGGPGPPPVATDTVYVLHTANTSEYIYPLDTLRSDDYNQLINMKDFKFQLRDDGCVNNNPLILVLIHTAPSNFKRRKSIRETWGHVKNTVKIVFLLGKILDYELQNKVEEENRLHGDFVQGNFVDAYVNMTYKHVMAFKYAVYHCPKAKYVLKTDDDIFINMPTLIDFLNVELSPHGTSNLILCKLYKESTPKRSYRSKWRVSFKEYPYSMYPPYCSGWSVMYSPNVVFTLYQKAQKVDYFWIDDVLITGVLVLNTPFVHIDNKNYVISDGLMRIALSRIFYNGTKFFLFGQPDIPVDDVYLLWDFIRGDELLKLKDIQ